MPKLFMSYKRGTAAVLPLIERLRNAHYRVWYDQEDIHASQNWRNTIDLNIDDSDAMIVGLTKEACESEYVLHEVVRMREEGKPIFGLRLERFDVEDLRKLGLQDIHYLDFTDPSPGTWDRQFQRLLNDLQKAGLGLTPHDLRHERTPDNPVYLLHQQYLKQLVGQIGMLNLAQIDEKGHTIELERVYIDSPTPLAISVTMQDWRVVNWEFTDPGPIEKLDRRVFDPIIGDLEEHIERYRIAHPELMPDDRFQNEWCDGDHEGAVPLSLGDLAASCHRLVILGTPGSGKSTFVRHLALCLAGEQIVDWARPNARLSALKHWTHHALTPVYVELRRFVASRYFPSDISVSPTADDLWHFIQADLAERNLQDFGPDLHYDLQHGNAVLILDGLDEVPFPEDQLTDRQRQLRELATSLNSVYGASRILVASRPYAYEGWTLPDFVSIKIAQFTDEHRIALATQLYRAADLPDAVAVEKAALLNEQLVIVHPDLKDRPLFVTLMATIFLRNGAANLPARRGTLYYQSILLLLDRWTQSKPGAPSLPDILSKSAGGKLTIDDLYKRLAALAEDVHTQFGDQSGTPEIDDSLIYRHLRPFGKEVLNLIDYLSANAAVLVSPGQNETQHVFHFAHRTFQEYLTACQIADQCHKENSFTSLRSRLIGKPLVWRDVGLLVADVLADSKQPDDRWNLIEDLAGPEPALSTTDPAWWAIWLAAMIAHEQGFLTPLPTRRSEKSVCDLLRERLTTLIEQIPEALPPYERAKCGRVLSLLGDPREGVGIDRQGNPDFAWRPVPGGSFYFRTEQTLRELPDFSISKFQVTVAQYQAFIDAADGYAIDTWWEGLSRPADGPADSSHKFANHARDDVSWNEAKAFCRWASARLNVQIDLPTEMEWEKAARGSEGLIFPTGDTYDPTVGNYIDSTIGHTCTVGLFPRGISPYGAFDMAGNIWELTLDQAQMQGAGRGGRRIGRGGCWHCPGEYRAYATDDPQQRDSSRMLFQPRERGDYFGFRVVKRN